MLDSDPDQTDQSVGLAPAGPSSVAVGPLLSDLVALHRAAGTPIELDLADDLRAAVPPECQAHIVTNLLVNCARHAPGAQVRLAAFRRADHVVIRVADDGPGLPPGPTGELLLPRMRGASGPGWAWGCTSAPSWPPSTAA